jgi:hypothetical protein
MVSKKFFYLVNTTADEEKLMFRLIGLAVVIFFAFIGWNQIQSVYEGDISGKEAITEIRNKSADAIKTKDRSGSHDGAPALATTEQPSTNSSDDKDPFAEANKLLSK